jgi:hypothetical protein
MNFDGNFISHGRWDHIPFRDRLLSLPARDWLEHTPAASVRGRTHAHTETLPVLFDEDFRHMNGTRRPHFELFEPCINPLLARFETIFGGGYPVRIIVPRLFPRATITAHADGGHSLPFVHRIHMPLTTNPQVEFVVGGETRQIAEGEIWEINNTRIHSVRNRGMATRIHLIVDWTTDALIAQRQAITGLMAHETPPRQDAQTVRKP